MKKIWELLKSDIRWVAFALFVLGLLGTGIWLIIREVNYDKWYGDEAKVETVIETETDELVDVIETEFESMETDSTTEQ